jgi:hypothetical protein
MARPDCFTFTYDEDAARLHEARFPVSSRRHAEAVRFGNVEMLWRVREHEKPADARSVVQIIARDDR